MARRLRRRRRWILWLPVIFALLVTGRWLFDRRQPRVPEALDDGTYAIESVVTADTILLRNGAQVRLLGIDAQADHHRDATLHAADRRGTEAMAFAQRFLQHGSVQLRFDRERIDGEGNFLAYVYVNEQSLNEALLRNGLARTRRDVNYSERFKRRFRAAENEARQAGRGVWSQ